MSDMDDMLVEPFRRMLAEVASPDKVRAAQACGDITAIWGAIRASGFLDALLPEPAGGAGLTLADTFPLVAETGAFCLPVPFAETMVARALLHARGGAAPDDAIIVIAPPSAIVPLAGVATHALVPRGDRIVLVPVRGAGSDPFGALGGVVDGQGDPVVAVEAGGVDLMVFAAGLAAAKMAGAMRRLLDMALGHAQERQQFGRSLGKFQAIQHQLAVMAEQVVSAKVAANIGMGGVHFDPLKVALAKCRTSEAAHQVCAIAHAVHGAIGVTEEYDLQLLTRRVKQWQMAFGSESHWAARIGAARIGRNGGTSADFVRECLQVGEQA
jgi:acyl-CoA dehydrogenase